MTDLPTAENAQQALLDLSDTARKYGINPDRPFFPVNSLRLLYFMILDQVTGSNEAIEKMNTIIPKVEAVLAARNQNKLGSFVPTLNQDLEVIKTPLQDLFQVLDTPNIQRLFEELFGFLLLSQDHQLASFGATFNTIQKPSPELLFELIELRAQDSIIFSTYIIELIKKYSTTERSTAEEMELFSYIHWQVHTTYQVNDLVDAVIFAKEDMEANAFSPLKIIQKITQDPQEAKTLIQEVAATLLKHGQSASFSSGELDQIISSYNNVLLNVIGL